MGRAIVALCGLLLLLIPWQGVSENLHVPEIFPTIQAAVDAARPGDTVLVNPGNYSETVRIDGRRNITLRGELKGDFSEEVDCWTTVAEHATDVIISGTIIVRSSQKITIEALTLTGPGPGIQIGGDAGTPASDVVVRYCNLIFNEGSCVDLVDHYLRVFINCSNVSSDPRVMETTQDVLRDTEIHVTCSLFRRDGGGAESPGAPVTVAVIDSGIDRSIPALNCYMWRNMAEIPDNGVDDDGNGYVDDIYGWDFSDNDADSLRGTGMHWHGTFVAGVLADAFEALMPPTGEGQNLRIMDLRFLNTQGQFYMSDWPELVRAIDYAVAQGARVINMSIYASREPPDEVREAVQRAIDQGVLVVAIAGNDASVLGPIAGWQEIVTVGAVDVEGEVASFSNVGAAVDVAARGVNVLSLLPEGVTRTQSGTSFAAPLVAGVAAFHVSINPSLSPSDIETILRASAVDVGAPGHDIETGWGIIE